MGIAIGVREMSFFPRPRCSPAGVMRVEAVTMPQAVWATINPPAIFSTGSEMPKKLSTKRPKNMKTTRMPNTYIAVFRAVRLRSSAGEIGGQRKKQWNSAERIHDGKQRQKSGGRRRGQGLQNLCNRVSGHHQREVLQHLCRPIQRCSQDCDLLPGSLQIVFINGFVHARDDHSRIAVYCPGA